MADREKVMRGLTECIKHPNLLHTCEACPYYAILKADGECVTCLMRDALALLREQEARVLTLDDVCGGDECWIEYKYGGCGYADIYLSDHLDGTAQVYRCRPVGENKPETVWLRDYGKFWRGWTSRPTEEQRKAVSWEPTKGDRYVQDEN